MIANNTSTNNAVSVINNRISIKNSSVERLSRVIAAYNSNNESRAAQPPMVSLPENDNYWCEGWRVPNPNPASAGRFNQQNSDELNNDNELVISSSSLSTPLSTSSSSSPSPSPSNQSSTHNNNSTSNYAGQGRSSLQQIKTFTSVDFESVVEQSFRESFADKVNDPVF
jgi:hypothetical protein